MVEEIYPMPLFPILVVHDLDTSSMWYQDVLGFKLIFSMPGLGGVVSLVHLRWVKYADLMIARPRDGEELLKPRGAGVSLNFQLFDRFNGDINAFAKKVSEKGANIAGPIDQPWNVREVTVLDPDGYQLTFTQPINPNLGFDKLIERVSKKPTV
jgi:uncharacterized glyoxalase superfamily protein PhnB